LKRIIPITLAMLLIAAGAFAAPPPPPPPGGGPAGAQALADYLGLTESQKATLRSIETEFRAATESLHNQLRALHDQLDDAREANDSSAVTSLMQQMRALHDQIRDARRAADAKFAAGLTTGQKTKFEAFQAAVEFLRERGPGGGAHP